MRKINHAMQDSVSQYVPYGNHGMYYMGNRAIATTPHDAEEDCRSKPDFHLELQARMCHPIAFHANVMGDIMYFYQALQQPGAAEFVKVLIKEIDDPIKNKRWKLVKWSEAPKDVNIFLSISGFNE